MINTQIKYFIVFFQLEILIKLLKKSNTLVLLETIFEFFENTLIRSDFS